MKTKTFLLQLLVSTTPLVFLLFTWSHLPARVPMHYDHNMHADSFGGPQELFVVAMIMAALSLGVALLINNLNWFDPKRRFGNSNKLLLKISWTLIVFMAALSSIMIYEAIHYDEAAADNSPRIMFLLISLLFIVLGNFMNNIKPNYFVGIRTPWALENEDNWRRTHHLASKIWFFGGMVMLLLFLFVPLQYIGGVLMTALIPLVLIPVIYSYNIFRQEGKAGK